MAKLPDTNEVRETVVFHDWYQDLAGNWQTRVRTITSGKKVLFSYPEHFGFVSIVFASEKKTDFIIPFHQVLKIVKVSK